MKHIIVVYLLENLSVGIDKRHRISQYTLFEKNRSLVAKRNVYTCTRRCQK